MPADLDQNQLVAKEVDLGVVREIEESHEYIGLRSLAPFKSVESDDVIFSYVIPDTEGLAPARAEDAEAEMAQKDDTFGTGRASIIDWAIKDRYATSDVTRYRDLLQTVQANSPGSINLTVSSITETFEANLARDTLRRKQKLDARLEKLAVDAVWENQIDYNDGNLMFTVPYNRPDDQHRQAPPNGLWNTTTADPIDDLYQMQEMMYERHGLRPDRGWTSEKVLRNILTSDKFKAITGLAVANVNPSATTGGTPIDPKYLISGWGWRAAQAIVEQATGITLTPYDAVYRQRPLGSTVMDVRRFSAEDDIVFLPPESVINEISDLGFGSMMTSPHAAGNWSSGFYTWEKDHGQDPWQIDRGTGIKAFPVFPHMEFSYSMTVL